LAFYYDVVSFGSKEIKNRKQILKGFYKESANYLWFD